MTKKKFFSLLTSLLTLMVMLSGWAVTSSCGQDYYQWRDHPYYINCSICEAGSVNECGPEGISYPC